MYKQPSDKYTIGSAGDVLVEKNVHWDDTSQVEIFFESFLCTQPFASDPT